MVSVLKSVFSSIKLDWGYSQAENQLCTAGSTWCWHWKDQEAQLIQTCEGMTKVFSFLVENLQGHTLLQYKQTLALRLMKFLRKQGRN